MRPRRRCQWRSRAVGRSTSLARSKFEHTASRPKRITCGRQLIPTRQGQCVVLVLRGEGAVVSGLLIEEVLEFVGSIRRSHGRDQAAMVVFGNCSRSSRRRSDRAGPPTAGRTNSPTVSTRRARHRLCTARWDELLVDDRDQACVGFVVCRSRTARRRGVRRRRHLDVLAGPKDDIHGDQGGPRGIVQRSAQRIINHVRSARWGPWYPDSSPSRASPGCAVRRTFTFSASMSARVAKSVGDLSKASQRFAVPGAHDGSARFRRGDGQLRVTEGHMLTTRAIPPASDSGTSFGSTVRSATGVVRNCCRDGGLQPRTKAADLKRSPHGASNGHRRRVLPCA